MPVEIRAERLCKSFRGRSVLRDINAEVRTGEILAIVGASGSGKTVFLDHLVGLLRPDSGRVLVADHDARREGGRGGDGASTLVDLAELSDDELDRIRLRWALVFQRNALFSGTVRDNIALWLREHTDLAEPDIERRIRESLKAAALDVDDVIDKDRDALSGGMAKRVAIARAIAIDPLVVFYDEPTTGLDPIVGGHIHELIWNVHHRPVGGVLAHTDAGGGGGGWGVEGEPVGIGPLRTSIIVTHDKELLRRLRPRVLMLHGGGVCYDGPYERFGVGPDCPEAQQYLAAMPVLHARVGGGGGGGGGGR